MAPVRVDAPILTLPTGLLLLLFSLRALPYQAQNSEEDLEDQLHDEISEIGSETPGSPGLAPASGPVDSHTKYAPNGPDCEPDSPGKVAPRPKAPGGSKKPPKRKSSLNLSHARISRHAMPHVRVGSSI